MERPSPYIGPKKQSEFVLTKAAADADKIHQKYLADSGQNRTE